jgi:hypothetical protein
MSSRRGKTAKDIKEPEKRQSQAKWPEELERAQINKKNSKSTQKLKRARKAQNQHSPEINSP